MSFEAYAIGLCNASVCTCLPDDEVTARLNIEVPTGVGPWQISEDPMFADGIHTNPCPCPDRPGNRHILFNC